MATFKSSLGPLPKGSASLNLIPIIGEENIKRKTINKISFYDTKQTIAEEVQSIKSEMAKQDKKKVEKLVVDMDPVDFDNKTYSVEQELYSTNKELRT